MSYFRLIDYKIFLGNHSSYTLNAYIQLITILLLGYCIINASLVVALLTLYHTFPDNPLNDAMKIFYFGV